MHTNSVTKFQTKQIIGFLSLALLVLLNYGLVWGRGGYADDFVFLSFIEGKTVLDTVIEWPFNSRITQSALFPILFKLASSTSPTEFNWWIIHTLCLINLILIIYFIDAILKLFEAPWLIRFISCLFFALYPIKNTTIMWPATIIGYVIPLLLFLSGTYLYLSRAKNNNENMTSLLIVWLFYVLSVFSIEQILPLVLITILVRLFVFPEKNHSITPHLFGGVSLFALFIGINLLGKTSERIARHSLDSSLLEKIFNVSLESIQNFIEYPFRIIFDSYYHPQLQEAATEPTFIFSATLLLIISILIFRESNLKNYISIKNTIYLLIGGVVFWFAAFSPLMVVGYYLPNRVFFIPLVGISISIACFISLLCVYSNLFRYFLAFCIFIAGSIFCLINIYSQDEFNKQWLVQKTLIESLSNDNITVDSTIHFFNAPNKHSPSPKLRDNFTFNGMVNWIQPGKNIAGDTLSSIDSVFKLPEHFSQNSEIDQSYKPDAMHITFLWSNQKQKPIEVSSLHLSSIKHHQNSPLSNADADKSNTLYGKVLVIEKSIQEDQYNINIPYLVSINDIDMGILKINLLEVAPDINKHRLNIHVTHINGTISNYDTWINPESDAWTYKNNNLTGSIILNDISSIQSVAIFNNVKNSSSTLFLKPIV